MDPISLLTNRTDILKSQLACLFSVAAQLSMKSFTQPSLWVKPCPLGHPKQSLAPAALGYTTSEAHWALRLFDLHTD